VLYTFERPKASSYTIALKTGTYDLLVSAWKGADKTELAAQGRLNGMVVNEAVNDTYTVTLGALMNSGETGSFHWVIMFPDGLKSASMTITPVNAATGTEEEIITIPVNGMSYISSHTLKVGYYTVTFELERDDKQKIIFHEILHVYQNLESYYENTFRDEHFSAIKYSVTFVYDDGTTPDLSEDKWHDQKLTYNAPLTNKPISAGLYRPTPPAGCTFTGWYVSGVLWDFYKPVTGDMTLTAHWTAQNLVDVSGADGDNDVTKAVNYAKNNPGAYTLLIGAPDLAANTSVNIGSHTLPAGCNLTIRGMGDGERGILGASAASPLFTINGTGASLTLGSGVTLYGITNGTTPLVTVSNGSLIMETGSKITGHTTSSANGAVYISYGGPPTSSAFTMKGGEITGNRSTSAAAESAGGVFAVGDTGINLQGGSIYRNTVSSPSRPGDVFKQNGTPLNLSGNAQIGYLTLRSTAPGGANANAVVSITSGWSGSVSALNLHAVPSAITEVMAYWENNTVLQGAVNTATVAKFPLGNFMGNNGAIQPVGDSYFINNNNGVLTPSQFTVTFNSAGGSQVSDRTITYGRTLTEPSAPARDGFKFDGWYKEASLNNLWNFATDIITGPTTMYAKWLAGQNISFIFNPDNSPVITTGVVIYRSSANGNTTASLTISNHDDYTDVFWYYNNIMLGNSETVELDSSDIRYNMLGPKWIRVEVTKDGIPYSKNVEFEVQP